MERRAGIVVSLQFVLPLAFAWTRLATKTTIFETEDGYIIKIFESWASRASFCDVTQPMDAYNV